ncbi:signal transduction histidine kinase/ActR/RegA family two-component response regulator [Erwinia toletana]|uniref:histidine kinase n=1 Tax=Winslowiella toletana TaxID=92490 RepID=A0ABS4P3R4_9GAMM|nr:ATP-binding protein [Winslowiella toletana]MBP2167299.1 signal transduction histidine kinase/ActR/RegA family two-component response regulator [Winslowiella toletana]
MSTETVYPRRLAGARGRLLIFNLLVVAVTLMVSAVAIIGFNHAGAIQEQAQAQTLDDMTGSLALARDTASVATSAARLSQVVGALEYQSEAARLRQTQQALQQSLLRIAAAPLASREPQLVSRISQRSLTLEQSVSRLLTRGHQRHLQRNMMLSGLYQAQLQLHHINDIMRRDRLTQPPLPLRQQIDRLITVATLTPSPLPAIQQWRQVMLQWPQHSSNTLLNDKIQRLLATGRSLPPLAQQLADSDLAIAYHTYQIKALVAMLNEDITLYVGKVAQETTLRTAATHHELNLIILFITLFALLSLVITGFAGFYIYRNLGSNLTAIASAMTRLAQGQRDVSVPALQRRDELGDLARAFSVFARNTASLEHTSRLLKEKSNQLESTFLAMRDGFALFDGSGHLVVWNSQYPLLLGLAAQQLHRGQHYQQLLRQLAPQSALNLSHDLPEPQELRLHDGRVIELRFSPVPHRGMVNTVLERTERKALEEALVHSQKMKAVGQLTGGLAHDFNNLLAVIIGSLELIDRASVDAQSAQRISRALKAAERAAQLTQRLLAFSRKQALHPQAVQVASLAENLQELMSHSLSPGQTLAIEAQQPGWLAWIDAGQLENALINLVVNARDALGESDGEIKIRIYNQRVEISPQEKSDRVTIEVIDHGCGMSEEVRAQVFEPFFTTKAPGSGSGLGLSMVYGFVRQSGGGIQLETAPGQGTLVRLQLPRAPAQLQPASRTPEPEQAGQHDRLVLVLDDEADVRQTLCDQLHQLGYLTLECTTGDQALTLLQRTADISMLVSDLMLPGGLNGAEVIRQAQSANPALATLLVSGQDLRQQQQGALPLCERLAKPYSQSQLAQAMRRAWQRSLTASRLPLPADHP